MVRKGKRKSRAMDPAVKGLRMIYRGMLLTPRYMRRANLEFCWDKWVTHAEPVKEKP